MTTTEKIEQAIINFVRGGDKGDVALLDSVLHKDFRVTNSGFMGTQRGYHYRQGKVFE